MKGLHYAGEDLTTQLSSAPHGEEVVKAAFIHRGYALVDIFQPCVTFNKSTPINGLKENTYILDDTYDHTDFDKAIKKAFETMPMPLGIIYQDK